MSLICRAENVSISWLLEGKGRPFIVHRFDADEAAADYLELLLRDESGWNVYEIAAPDNRHAVVLTMPGAVERKGNRIHYTILEAVVGDVGDRARSVVLQYEDENRLHSVTIDNDTMSRLAAGQLGTWHLVGDAESPGILEGAKPDERIREVATCYAPPPTEAAREVAHWFDGLTAEKQDAFRILFDIDFIVDDD